MTSNHAEVLSAFFDGEAVDAEALAASLQEPDAIEFLVEFARLRRAVYDDESRPPEEFCDALRETMERGDRRRRTRRRLVQMSLAASVAFAAALGGFTVRGVLERRHPGTDGRATQARESPAQASTPGTVQRVSAPATATPEGAEPVRSKQAIPSPALRVRFAEWRDRVL